MKILAAAALALSSALAQAPDVQQIMSRVGINQAKAQELRQNYVYHQTQLLRMMRGNGKLAREEHRDYVITPELHRVRKQLAGFQGKYESHGAFLGYQKPGYHYKDLDIDGELLNEMSEDMTNDGKARDGIGSDLFPLTYHEQLKYTFHLVGTESYRNRQVWRVAFEPDRSLHHDETIWKGEALIDCAEYQPVLVTTKMARKLPLMVRTLLGTDVKGLGFSVSYARLAEGVWFPVSYGGEFEIRAVFFYKRTIAVSLVNTDFRHTDVTSSVAYKMDQQ